MTFQSLDCAVGRADICARRVGLGGESVIELNKEAYYLALRQTQGTIRTDAPNWQPWLLFFS